ncbi:MAG: NADP(H)-dependent aldo-keto reductase [Rugosibacter sp.]|nr:NADP(H)-dependent aldo-keto reductase [Rugosibacter sp.]
MKFANLGKSGLRVSSVCLGTMTFGQQNSEAEAHEQLDYAFTQGVNFIDTAEMYPVPPRAETTGATERIIGTWLKHQVRDRIVLATKAAGTGRIDWIRDGMLTFDRKNLRAAVDSSLDRLQTDYIDLYQLHWPDRNVPTFGQYQFEPEKERAFVSFVETLQALDELMKEGKIRHIGLSNETPWGVMQFLQTAQAHGLPRIVSIQNAYSLLNRTWDMGLAEVSYRENIPLLAYSPLAFGFLSGKYLVDPAALGRATLFAGFAQRYAKVNMSPAVAAYVDLACHHNMTPVQLALSFVASRWFVGSTIIGATTMAQLKENITACAKPLAEEVLQEIEALHLRYPNPAP